MPVQQLYTPTSRIRRVTSVLGQAGSSPPIQINKHTSQARKAAFKPLPPSLQAQKPEYKTNTERKAH